jgi:hypothetical protein
MGVHPDYRNCGAQAITMRCFSKNVKENHIVDVFADPILTTNEDMHSMLKGMDTSLRCKRQTFKKHL